MKNYKVTQTCWVAADRTHHIVATAIVPALSALAAADSITSADSGHSPMCRDSSQDNSNMTCFVSDLGHVFMVSPLD